MAKKLLKEILVSRGENQGNFFEMMTYYCLLEKGILFQPQPYIEAEFCYKNNGKGYEADGEILEFSCVFDVKKFGIGFSHIKDFEVRLQEQVDQLLIEKRKDFFEESKNTIKKLEENINSQESDDLKNQLQEEIDIEKRKQERMIEEVENNLWNYIIKVDGLINIATEELSICIEKKVVNIAKELVDQAWKDRIDRLKDCSTWNSNSPIVKYGAGVFSKTIEGLSCKLEQSPKNTQEVHGNTKVYEIDAYEWAMNNKFYFMGDASQFVSNKPYIIICTLDRHDNVFLHNVDDYDVFFRPLCRRIFIELNRMTDKDIQTSFDGKAKPGFSVSEAVKKITGIIFLETSELTNTERFRTPMWLYFNPNADNPLLNYQINQFSLIMPEIIEDYKYDNY